MEQLGLTLKFNSQSELLSAIKTLKPLHFFAVISKGKQHEIEFKSIADATRAKADLEELAHAKQ